MHPVIEEIKQEMKECGALNAMMSGSGPTVFGLFENRTRRVKHRDVSGRVTGRTSVCDQYPWSEEELRCRLILK